MPVCNINLIMNKRKINDSDIKNVINVMSHDGFYLNDDGQGFLTLKKEKEGTKYYLSKKLTEHLCKDTGFLTCSHERASTSGTNNPKGNIQPIETNDFIILHNGILHSQGDNDLSDTHHLILDFQKRYIEGLTDIKRLIRTIMEETAGSYSILLYFKPKNQLYYFKNNQTTFYKVSDRDYLVLSTTEDNVKYAKQVLNINGEIKSVLNDTIYDVMDNFQTIGTFKPLITYYSSYSSDKDFWKDYPTNNGEKKDYAQEIKDEKEFDTLSDLMDNKEFREYALKDFMDYYYDGVFMYENEDGFFILGVPLDTYHEFKRNFNICVEKRKGDKLVVCMVDGMEFVNFMSCQEYDWLRSAEEFKSENQLNLIEYCE